MSTASDLLDAYLAAELAVLRRQSYTIGDRTLTFADLNAIRTERKALERRVAAEMAAAGGAVGPRHRLADFSSGS